MFNSSTESEVYASASASIESIYLKKLEEHCLVFG